MAPSDYSQSRLYPRSLRCRLPRFACTALNRDSRIVSRVGRDVFLLSMQLFESALLPLPCERETLFGVSCTLIRSGPAARLSVDHCRLSFTMFGRDSPCLRTFARVYTTCVAFRLVNSNFTFRVAHVGGLRGVRSTGTCWPTWTSRILPVLGPDSALYGREGRRR